jgi:hypothetical protein
MRLLGLALASEEFAVCSLVEFFVSAGPFVEKPVIAKTAKSAQMKFNT